ncbi:hypothetical protein ABZ477_09110 [Microbacterium sp. NPDC019599]|uniref:hypothetical protein n=1 Tax=Microbacterium sp. NPDC019599 TaxID=3154690 RepID=UPI0033DCB9EB
MVDVGYPRDLALIAAIFGLAAFVWAGWAQEHPPRGAVWRVVLGALGLAGLALAAVGIVLTVHLWGTPTAIEPGTPEFFLYVVVFWVEFIGAGIVAFFVIRAGMSDFIAPIVLGVVGIHFFALAPVFHQPFLFLPAVLLTAAALAAAFIPSDDVARSFWCGLLGAPVFLAVGAWAAIAAGQTLPG